VTPKMPQGLRLISMVCPSFVPILVKLSEFAVSCAEKPHYTDDTHITS